MKLLVSLTFILLSTFVCYSQKQELINQVITAIEESGGASYESTITIEVPTLADTTIKIKYLSRFDYMMNEYDTLYFMNFRFDKREKTHNFDRLKSLIYSGQYFYSVEKIKDNYIPDPSYRKQDLSNSSGTTALQKSIYGQLPHIYKALKTKDPNEIITKSDTIYDGQKYSRIAFMEDEIDEFEVWIGNDYFPSRVIQIAHVNRKKPQIVSSNNLANYSFFSNEKGELENPELINLFSINESQIQLKADPNTPILKHLSVNSQVPEIIDTTVAGVPLQLDPDNEKVKLIFFGMINCCPCVQSLPHLKNINNIFSENRHFEMVAFYPYDPPSVLEKYSRKEKINYPICAGGKDVVKAFGLHAYPDLLLVDRKGRVYKWYNYSEDMTEILVSAINRLLKN
ncbi:redoxin family protein [uncultured Draconibacterium sp.]|uniref:TlpA family protein disulfide reductase n=1 Tax=uncultured Draconibacterium sp. TaxID=1573823 RepID=UPI0025EAB2DB|nr:redoxin family protein [uncultured Draconibacterium sp.]